jgi:TolB-like protein
MTTPTSQDASHKTPHRARRRHLALAASLLLASCASGPTRYLHPNADLGAVQKVAVLPFENVSGVAGASDKVHKIFLVELLALEAFDVVEPGLVSKAVRAESATSPDQLTPDDLKRIGAAMGADGLFIGQVVDYADARGSNAAPEVTVQLRLVEVTSGVTVWSTSLTQGGVKASSRLFGVSADSTTETTRRLLRKQLATLLR